MKNRSSGVIIFGILCLLSGAMMMRDAVHGSREALRTFANLKAQHVLDEAGYERFLHQNQLIFPTVMAIGTAWLIAGVGLLLRKKWGRLLALVSAGISVLGELRLSVPSIVTHEIPFLGYLLTQASIKEFRYELLRDLYIWLRAALTVGWYSLFLWYFTRPSVKVQFQKQT